MRRSMVQCCSRLLGFETVSEGMHSSSMPVALPLLEASSSGLRLSEGMRSSSRLEPSLVSKLLGLEV